MLLHLATMLVAAVITVAAVPSDSHSTVERAATSCSTPNKEADGTYNLNPCPLDPLPCYGNCVSYNDESVIRRQNNSKLFRFGVLDGSMYTFTADSWVKPWTKLQGVFLRHGGFVDPVRNQSDETWTPDVHYINEKYYIFARVSLRPRGSDAASIRRNWLRPNWAPKDGNIKPNGSLSYAISPDLEIGSWTDISA